MREGARQEESRARGAGEAKQRRGEEVRACAVRESGDVYAALCGTCMSCAAMPSAHEIRCRVRATSTSHWRSSRLEYFIEREFSQREKMREARRMRTWRKNKS